MGLSITVQKGHDFSSGNVTRAALNAGATPTIAITGSVGASEIAASSISNAQVKNDAAIATTKLALAADRLIIGDSGGTASVLSPTSSLVHTESGMGNDNDSNCALLVDTGSKFELLKTDVSDIGGQVLISKYLETVEGGDDKFWLKLTVGNETLGAAHLKEEDTVDKSSIVKDSSGKFSIRDNGVHYTKLYTYIKSNGVKNAGFLAYGAEGAAHVIEATADPKVLVTAGANNNMEGKVHNKIVQIGTFTSNEGWMRKEHGLTNAPTSVSLVLECTGADDAHGYASGDRIYDLADTRDNTSGMVAHADATYVTAIVPGDSGAGGNWELPKKYGADTPNSETHSGSGRGYFEWVSQKDHFKVLAIVNE